MHSYRVALDCTDSKNTDPTRQVIFLQELEQEEEYARIDTELCSIMSTKEKDFDRDQSITLIKRMRIRQQIRHQPMNVSHGFEIQSLRFRDCPPFQLKKTMIYSRDGNVTQYSGEKISTTIPPANWGTSAIIVPPSCASNRGARRFQCIHLGFDADFYPFCIIARRRPCDIIARTIVTLHAVKGSHLDQENQKSELLLKALEEKILQVDRVAMNVDRDDSVEGNLPSKTVHRAARDVRYSHYETVTKAHRSAKTIINFDDQWFKIQYILQPPSTDRPSIWVVQMSNRDAPIPFTMIPVLPLYAIAYLLGRLDDSPYSDAQIAKKKILAFTEEFSWLTSYIQRYLLSPVRKMFYTVFVEIARFGVIVTLGALLPLFIVYSGLSIYTSLNPQTLTTDDVRALLNGTAGFWEPRFGLSWWTS